MLAIDLRGKKAFVAGIGDDKGFGWAIAKALIEAGAEVVAGCWPPLYELFLKGWELGHFDQERQLSNGSLLEFAAVYPFDAAYDTMEQVPEEVRENKRYKKQSQYAIYETSQRFKEQFGSLDLLIHSLANSPEIQKPLLETSRKGYLATLSASSYSFVSMMAHFGPCMNRGGKALCLSFLAGERVVPGYGGGMSSAKAALEADTRYLAYEAGRQWAINVNCISAGPWASRAAKAIGAIDQMVDHYKEHSPLQRAIQPKEVGQTAAFLCSSLADAITGVTLHLDCGYHIMGTTTKL